jgi:hypothetical protein
MTEDGGRIFVTEATECGHRGSRRRTGAENEKRKAEKLKEENESRAWRARRIAGRLVLRLGFLG